MANGTQQVPTTRSRILTRPRSEWSARTTPSSSECDIHPTGTWRAQITMSAQDNEQQTIAEQAVTLKARIERWLGSERLRPEVARIDVLDGRIAVFITCSSRCKHRLRRAFPDLETTSGATRVAHLT